MKQGELGQAEVTKKVLHLAMDEKDHAISDFMKECKCAKNTMYKYLGELVETDHYLEKVWGTGKAHFKARFRITIPGTIEYNRICVSEQFPSVLDGLTKEELQNVIVNLEERLVLTRRLFLMAIEDIRKLSKDVVAFAPRFVEDPRALLPKNAELISSSDTEEERKQAEMAPRVRYFYKRETQPQKEPLKAKRKGHKKRIL